jgi:hypothetical protein
VCVPKAKLRTAIRGCGFPGRVTCSETSRDEIINRVEAELQPARDTKKDNELLSGGALSYFAIDSRNKTGENGFVSKPSQDGEDKLFEKLIKRILRLVL